MEKVRSGEVDTPEEVEKVLNMIIDKINENDDYNKTVEKYNGEIEKGDKDA